MLAYPYSPVPEPHPYDDDALSVPRELRALIEIEVRAGTEALIRAAEFERLFEAAGLDDSD